VQGLQDWQTTQVDHGRGSANKHDAFRILAGGGEREEVLRQDLLVHETLAFRPVLGHFLGQYVPDPDPTRPELGHDIVQLGSQKDVLLGLVPYEKRNPGVIVLLVILEDGLDDLPQRGYARPAADHADFPCHARPLPALARVPARTLVHKPAQRTFDLDRVANGEPLEELRAHAAIGEARFNSGKINLYHEVKVTLC